MTGTTDDDNDQFFVKLAKLDYVWKLFPEDVRVALRDARALSARLPRPTDPAEEPWPPMRVGTRS